MPFSFALQSGFFNSDLELRGMYAFAKCLFSPKELPVNSSLTGILVPLNQQWYQKRVKKAFFRAFAGGAAVMAG